ncbi:MAG: hypothetical protein KDA24_15295 [Deltaproteobacteria bacterium]|nr:hypothetical protein [Deltaproteobacteria bacterium]
MRSRLALTCCALLLATLLPATAMADGSDEGISRYSTLFRASTVGQMLLGVPISADGIAGPEAGFGGEDDDNADGADGGADGDGAGTDTSAPASTNSDENGGYRTGNSNNESLNNSTGGAVSDQTLLDIIIGIIFGQDRPWESSEKRG